MICTRCKREFQDDCVSCPHCGKQYHVKTREQEIAEEMSFRKIYNHHATYAMVYGIIALIFGMGALCMAAYVLICGILPSSIEIIATRITAKIMEIPQVVAALAFIGKEELLPVFRDVFTGILTVFPALIGLLFGGLSAKRMISCESIPYKGLAGFGRKGSIGGRLGRIGHIASFVSLIVLAVSLVLLVHTCMEVYDCIHT